MTLQQRGRMIARYDAKRRAEPDNSKARALYKLILAMLGYSASVRTIAERSAKFHRRYGRTV